MAAISKINHMKLGFIIETKEQEKVCECCMNKKVKIFL